MNTLLWIGVLYFGFCSIIWVSHNLKSSLNSSVSELNLLLFELLLLFFLFECGLVFLFLLFNLDLFIGFEVFINWFLPDRELDLDSNDLDLILNLFLDLDLDPELDFDLDSTLFLFLPLFPILLFVFFLIFYNCLLVWSKYYKK